MATTQHTPSHQPAHIVLTGGTIMMGHDDDGSLKPFYDLRHLVTAMILRKEMLAQGQSTEACNKALKAVTTMKIGKKTDEEINTSLLDLLSKHGTQTFGGWNDIFQNQGIHADLVKPLAQMTDIKNGIKTGVKNGLIDSIDYDVNLHQQPIEEAFETLVDSYHHPAILVLGGTDSLEFYAPMLAKAAKINSFNTSPLGFTSSMHAFEDNPAYVADILQGSLRALHEMEAMCQKETLPRSGFLLAPKLNQQGEVASMAVHNLAAGVVKISSRLPEAFCSNAGRLMEVPLHPQPSAVIDMAHRFAAKNTHATTGEENAHATFPSHINVIPTHLPPITAGTSAEAISQLLSILSAQQSAHTGIPPTYILPIEYDPVLFEDGTKRNNLEQWVKQLAQHKVIVQLVDDQVPSPKTNHQGAFISAHEWRTQQASKAPEAHKRSKHMDGWVATLDPIAHKAQAPTPLAWIQGRAIFSGLSTTGVIPARPESPDALSLAIRYVPDYKAFEKMLDLAQLALDKAGHKTLIIEALPGNALPERVKPMLQKLINDGIQIKITSKFAGSQYTMPDGTAFIEGGNENQYAASSWLAQMEGVEISGTKPAKQLLAETQPQQNPAAGVVSF